MAHLPGRPEDSPPILRDVQDASLGTQWAGLGPPPPSCTFLFIVKKNTGRESCVKRPRLESRITRREPPRRLWNVRLVFTAPDTVLGWPLSTGNCFVQQQDLGACTRVSS
ncbi:uncharacterized protein LOC122678167 isoform X2 [Cervus elaphus]|uniref:uncharacterized protein LOC122678167 isoform X2 n=1 Tax=Cervus elaphus TaxID=9860 RepID=UPI001CC2A2FA|nr:uncharacterized protein LOC122678167 isoform X2 [Cervus elaphus]